MTFGIATIFDTIRERDASTFDTTFQTLGSPFTQPAIVVLIQNNTDQDLDFSTDGTNQHGFVPQGGFVLFDLETNKGEANRAAMQIGTQFYVRSPMGAGTGDVYLTVIRFR